MPTLSLSGRFGLFFLLLPLLVQAQIDPPIPSAPNLRNAAGQRVGNWVITYTKTWKETALPDSIAYYRLISFNKAGKPIGITRDFYRSGSKQWEGKMVQIIPEEIMEGICIWYYPNGNRSRLSTIYLKKEQDTTYTWYPSGGPSSVISYKNGLMEGLAQVWNKDGVNHKFWFEKGRRVDLDTLTSQLTTLVNRRLFLSAVPVAEKILDVRLRTVGKMNADYAADLNNLALSYEQTGQFNKALPLYKESLKIQEQLSGKLHPNYAMILTNIAALARSMGQYQEALTFATEALEIRYKNFGKEHIDYATTLNLVAVINVNLDNYKKGIGLAEESLAIVKRVAGKDSLVLASAMGNLAGIYVKTYQFEKATDLYENARIIIKSKLGQNHINYAVSLFNLAKMHVEMGQYEKVLPFYLESLSIVETSLGKLSNRYADVLFNLADFYQIIGQNEKAIPILKECLTIRERALSKLHPDYAMVLADLGLLQGYMGQDDESLHLFEDFRTLAKNIPDLSNSFQYTLALIKFVMLFQAYGYYEETVPVLKEALPIIVKVVGKGHPLYAETLRIIGTSYVMLGEFEKARINFEESKNILEKAVDRAHPTYISSLLRLALVYKSMEQYELAIPMILEAQQRYKVQLLQNVYMLNESGLVQFQEKLDFSEAVYSLGFESPKKNTVLLGQNYNDALLSKGMGLMASQLLNTLLTQTKDSVTIRIDSQLRSTKIILNRQLTLTLTKQQGVDSLQRKAADLEQQLVLRLPEYGQAFTSLRIEWPQIQQALKPDEAAIEFVSFRYYHKRPTDSTLYAALVLRPGYTQPKFVFLGEQRQFDQLLTAGTASPSDINGLYRGGVAETGNGSAQLGKGLALSRLIWQPLDSLLQGVKTVFVSPAGRLHQIALAALPNPADTSQRMADRFQIRQVGSTRVVALRTAQTEQPLAKNTLKTSLYGGITYDADSVGLVRQTRLKEVQQRLALREATRSGTWDYLPGTQAEVDNLRRILPATQTTYLTKETATEGSVKALSGHSPKILHIATHGFFFPDLPKPKADGIALVSDERNRFQFSENPLLRSGLVMAGANYVWKGGTPIEGVDDGILTAYELSNLNLRGTELVVLSACETGLGQVKGSEGVYGLQRAVKMAGARYLLMSLWRVSDKETAEYMTLFYQNLLEKGSVPAAYDYAQGQMRSRYPKEPFKWAAFVLVE
ncbi:tetratricopeptide repeat protein [Larkinella sp. GY13]|uniref:tetratricopeptide repeat protein n=1 Tax=Larkinella sp. GY13 TaxID=3453720 RepID=UPI003EF03D95